MNLSAAEITLLWQLGWLLIGALAISGAAIALAHRLRWPSSRPAFWWAALALVVLPIWLAQILPQAWSLPGEAFQWRDPGDSVNASAPEATTMAAATLPTWRLAEALYALWAAGALMALARLLHGHRQLRRLLADCPPLALARLPGPRSRRLTAALARRGIRLLACTAPVSPFAHGRRIVLPGALLARLDDAQCWLLLRHEAAHLRLRDPFWQGVLAVLLALHWFLPGLRPLARRLRLACELRCDARALGRRKHMRRAYAEAYLETLRMSATRALPCPAAAFSPQDQGHHKMRIGHILSSSPRSGKSRPLALGLLALGAGLALTAAQATAIGTGGPAEATTPDFRNPIIAGAISSHFGTERPQISSQPHRGIDLKAPRGTPVHAPADGVVLVAEAPFSEAPRYGTVVVLDHGNGWQTLYAHLDSLSVKRGDTVRAGDTLGGLGSTGVATGPHVHVEVHKDGERVDPASVIDVLVSKN